MAGLRRAGALLRKTKKKLAVAVRASGTSLTEVFGVGPVIAAMVIGDVRDVSRFRGRDRSAAYNGTAPIEVSSGMPFTVAVSVDPQNPVMPEECRQVVLPGPWRAPAPPMSVTQQAINSWERAQDGVDGAGTYVTIILQGTSDQAVTINAPQVVITSRQRSLDGPVAEMSGGCGGELRVRQFIIDLDQQQPVATFQDGTGLPAMPSASGAVEQAQSPVFTISDTDAEYFVVDATTTRSLVRWYLNLNWQSMGRSGTLPISDGSVPFATSAVNPAGHAFYYLRPGGTWSGPS